ncbi:hypothetical protein L9F63_007129, partial [Diploptera punctata]
SLGQHTWCSGPTLKPNSQFHEEANRVFFILICLCELLLQYNHDNYIISTVCNENLKSQNSRKLTGHNQKAYIIIFRNIST